ncbi:MAG: hypothetical protein KAS64_02820 [Spirochaetes bacterium]|nr:hypothetical protein [Spirochaetota bacterium]
MNRKNKLILLLIMRVIVPIASIFAYNPHDFRLPLKKYKSLENYFSSEGEFWKKDEYKFLFFHKLNYKSYKESESNFNDLEIKTDTAFAEINNANYFYLPGLPVRMYDESFSSGFIINNTFSQYLKKESDVFLLSSQNLEYRYKTPDTWTEFSIGLEIGIGIGRMRDLNAFYRADAIVRMLTDFYQLKRQISPVIVQQLAELIYRKDEYISKYDHFKNTVTKKYIIYGKVGYKQSISREEGWLKYFFKDMQKLLKKIKGLPKKLNFYMLEKIVEIIEKNVIDKSLGYKIYGTFGYNTSYDTHINTDYQSGITIGTGIEFALPLSTKWHLESLFTGKIILNKDSNYDRINLDCKIGFIYDVTDSIYIKFYALANFYGVFANDKLNQYQYYTFETGPSLTIGLLVSKKIILTYNMEVKYIENFNQSETSNSLDFSTRIGLNWRVF